MKVAALQTSHARSIDRPSCAHAQHYTRTLCFDDEENMIDSVALVGVLKKERLHLRYAELETSESKERTQPPEAPLVSCDFTIRCSGIAGMETLAHNAKIVSVNRSQIRWYARQSGDVTRLIYNMLGYIATLRESYEGYSKNCAMHTNSDAGVCGTRMSTRLH